MPKPLPTSMVEGESTSRDSCQYLGEIFVSLTGKTGTTERQSQEQDKKVIDVTGSKSPPQQNRPDTDFGSNGLEDAITDPQSE